MYKIVIVNMPMKWGFANTAALVLAHQKDTLYCTQLQQELKAVLLDWIDVRTFLKWEPWIDGGANVLYWVLLTGSGHASLGQEYVRILPVDLAARDFFLKFPMKRLVFTLLSSLLPIVLGKHASSLETLNAVQFYFTGKYPTLLHRLFNIRYIFYPRKPPLPDVDRSFYQLLAIMLATLRTHKQLQQRTQSNFKQASSLSKRSSHAKCPVCMDPVVSAMASAQCGHVCCWTCLVRWREREQNCPVCRKPCNAPDLIPIINL